MDKLQNLLIEPRISSRDNFDKLQSFFSRYLKKERELQGLMLKNEIHTLSCFMKGFLPIQQRWSAANKERASHFNVFEIMRFGHYEARFHTPFLCDLLSPIGMHGCGDLFAQAFILRFLPIDGLEDKEIHSIHVAEELIVESGRMDIWLSFYIDDAVYNVTLENKINHI